MGWIDVAARSALPPAGMMEVEAAGAALLVYDVAGVVYATDAICPHHAAWLSDGRMDGGLIDCPRHMGQFDIATGRKTRGPECPDLRTYPVKLERDRILIEVVHGSGRTEPNG